MLENDQLVGLSSVVGLVIVVLLVAGVSWALNKLGKERGLLDVIYDAEGYPSLSRFQFLAWTLVIIGAFTIVALIRLLGSTLAVDFQHVEVPENLVYLLGISVSVVPVSTNVSRKIYGDTTRKKGPCVARKPFATLLTENENPSLAKFQMFSWTIISIVIYIILFARLLTDFAMGSTVNGDPVGVFLPDIDFALVALMGLSQTAYVSGKWVLPKSPKIQSVDPEEVMTTMLHGTSARDVTITVRGLNFGKIKDTILIGSMTIDPQEITWGEDRIVFTLSPDSRWADERPSEKELKVLVGTKEATHKISFK